MCQAPSAQCKKMWGLTKLNFVVSGVVDTANHKKVNFMVKYLGEFRGQCLMEKKEVKISHHGVFK
jgi:hypothetical protein